MKSIISKLKKNKTAEEIESEIKLKKTDDKRKLKALTKISIITLSLRIFIYFLPFEIGGLLIEILWIPPLLLIISIPFYGFEKLLDKFKK